MEVQTVQLQLQLEEEVEFFFLEGPVSSEKAADSDVQSMHEPPFFEWFPRGSGLEEQEAALKHVTDHLKRHGPFDIMIGFSQGASVVTLLSAALEGARGAAPGGRGAPDLRGVPLPSLVVCVCGVPPKVIAPEAAEPGAAVVERIPSVHAIGITDPLKEQSTRLAWDWYAGAEKAFEAIEGSFGKVTVLYHTRGHCFLADCKALAAAMRRALQQHASPAEAGQNGAATQAPREDSASTGKGSNCAIL